ncbi:hypothetical protein D3C72_1500250 [compost metagenome]
MAEHGGSRLGFLYHAHGEIGLDQARQRFFDLVGVRIFLDHDAEARDGGQIFLAFQIVAADLHLLAGELVAGETDLGLGVVDVFGVRIVVDHLLHGVDRLQRGLLVLRDVGDLLPVGKADEILHVGGIVRTRIEVEVAVAGGHRLGVAPHAVLGEGAHHQRLLRPFGERMLGIDRVELARCLDDVAGLDVGETLIVEGFRRIGLDAELGDVDIGIGLAGGKQRAGYRHHHTYTGNTRGFIHNDRPYMTHSTVPDCSAARKQSLSTRVSSHKSSMRATQ